MITFLIGLIAFVTGIIIGISMKSFQYNTGYKNGYNDKEEQDAEMIGRLQKQIDDMAEKEDLLDNEDALKNSETLRMNGVYEVVDDFTNE